MKAARNLIGRAILSGFLALGGSALADEPYIDPLDGRDGGACIFARNIRDFQVIDSEHIIVEGPGRSRVYLITLFSSCAGVRSANSMAVSSRTGRVCGGRNERIMFDSAFSSCYIDQIFEVESRDEAREIAEKRSGDS